MRILPTTNIALLVLAFLHVPPAASADQSLSYSYFELKGDISTTANDARGARDDANGRLVGLTASWELRESWYAKASYSLERKTFSNEVAGTILSLDTRQAAATLGGGRGSSGTLARKPISTWKRSWCTPERTTTCPM